MICLERRCLNPFPGQPTYLLSLGHSVSVLLVFTYWWALEFVFINWWALMVLSIILFSVTSAVVSFSAVIAIILSVDRVRLKSSHGDDASTRCG